RMRRQETRITFLAHTPATVDQQPTLPADARQKISRRLLGANNSGRPLRFLETEVQHLIVVQSLANGKTGEPRTRLNVGGLHTTHAGVRTVNRYVHQFWL